MAGVHRGPKAEVSKMVRVPLDEKIEKTISDLARQELRSYGNMVSVLLREALAARRGERKK